MDYPCVWFSIKGCMWLVLTLADLLMAVSDWLFRSVVGRWPWSTVSRSGSARTSSWDLEISALMCKHDVIIETSNEWTNQYFSSRSINQYNSKACTDNQWIKLHVSSGVKAPGRPMFVTERYLVKVSIWLLWYNLRLPVSVYTYIITLLYRVFICLCVVSFYMRVFSTLVNSKFQENFEIYFSMTQALVSLQRSWKQSFYYYLSTNLFQVPLFTIENGITFIFVRQLNIIFRKRPCMRSMRGNLFHSEQRRLKIVSGLITNTGAYFWCELWMTSSNFPWTLWMAWGFLLSLSNP